MNYINRFRTKKKEPYTIYNSDNTINLVPLFDEYIDNTAINKLQTVINSFLSYEHQYETNIECFIEIKKYLLENMKNINNIADFECNFSSIYKYLSRLNKTNCHLMSDDNFVNIINKLKQVIMLFRDTRYIKKLPYKGGENNKEYIDYKFQNKIYRRIIRYDGKKKYIILNKIRVYI